MTYSENFSALKNIFLSAKQTSINGFSLHSIPFSSCAYSLLPGNKRYTCEEHHAYFQSGIGPIHDHAISEDYVNIHDVSVRENREFNIMLLKPDDVKRCKNVVLMLHGFNEKNWEKYLPWGEAISRQTQSAVIFFPIAFHMQRAPESWSEKREMFKLSEARKKLYPNVVHSTLSNVAISVRLHAMPQRFIWSGLQTYYDVIRFLENCKRDKQPLIHSDFDINIFAYSIGGLLAQSLKLTNYQHFFDRTKVCLFCSGAAFNRHSPVSKFILDSEANVALYSYLIEHFDNYLKKDPLLHHFISEDHPEGKVFHSLLDYQKMREFREGLLRKVEDQLYAITLANDTVIPSYEVVNSLQGAHRDINIRVDELDFDYPYIHENPFPTQVPFSEMVDESFENVFERVGTFFNG